MNTTNKNNMNNDYNTKIKEMKARLVALIKKIENNKAATPEPNSKDDDDCLFTKPLKPFEPELYVPFPKDSLTFDESQIDIRSPEYITQLDYLREKSVRVACSRNFCGNA